MFFEFLTGGSNINGQECSETQIIQLVQLFQKKQCDLVKVEYYLSDLCKILRCEILILR
eukprot:UN03239